MKEITQNKLANMNVNSVRTASAVTALSKLKALRQVMLKEKVDALLVPRADCHQGEFISDKDARLTWLSGFTGSAGLCIVTQKNISLFVDGRYWIQAESEKNSKQIKVLKLERQLIIEWLKLNLTKSSKVAFDPWLHTSWEIKNLKLDLEGYHQIIPTANLIDRLWKDKPKEAITPVYKLKDKYAGVSHQSKLEKTSKMMLGHESAFVIYTLPASICWLLNIRGNDIPNTPIVKAFAIQKDNCEIEVYLDKWKISDSLSKELGPFVKFFPIENLKNRLRKLEGKIWLDSKSCPFAIKSYLISSKTFLHDNEDPSSQLKAIKNATEIQGSRLVHTKDGIAMVKFLYWLSNNKKNNLDEISIITSLAKFRRKGKNYQGNSFDTICGTGPNAAIIHYKASYKTNRVPKNKDLLLIDSGGQYLEGTTDITRTIAIGKTSNKKKKHFTLVLKGMIAISRLMWPLGLSGRDLDSIARYPLWQEGLDYDHGTGHGVGSFLSVHEGPQALSRRNEFELKAGMIISNEPGFYLANSHGIRIENLLLVKNASPKKEGERRPMLCFETLTFCPIDKKLLLLKLLTIDEIKWFDDYHRKIKQKFKNKLASDVKSWLLEACSPLL